MKLKKVNKNIKSYSWMAPNVNVTRLDENDGFKNILNIEKKNLKFYKEIITRVQKKRGLVFEKGWQYKTYSGFII